MHFTLSTLSVSVCKHVRVHRDKMDVEVFGFRMKQLEICLAKQTYELRLVVRLGGVSVDVSDATTVVRILDTPKVGAKKNFLLTVDYKQVSEAKQGSNA